MSDFQDDTAKREAEAADWFVRLQSDDARADDWADFDVWLRADPANDAAFQRLETLWLDLDEARDRAIAPSLPPRPLAFTKVRKPAAWGVWAAPIGVAAVIAVAVLGPHLSHRSTGAGFQIAETAKGERKTVVLTDGTQVDLSSASKILYRIGPSTRTIALTQGEAVFTVGHDPARPFFVTAGDRKITDIGTTFDVERLDDAVQVTVKKGEVAVASADTPQASPVKVSAGFQLTHEDGDANSMVRPVDADAVLAWRSGRLVYRDAPLPTVVRDLDRYLETPIHVKGDRAAELRFTGVLVLDSEDAVVERLQAFMPVVAERSGDAVWISARP